MRARTILIAAVLLALPIAAEKTKEETQTLGVYGGDPKGYADAEAMFRRTLPAGAVKAADKLPEFSVVISTKRLPETNATTTAMLRSIGTITQQEYERLRLLAMDAARRMPRTKTPPPLATERFRTGNVLYEKGDLARAAEQYAGALRLAPDHLDARNNLGLAELHLGYDVSAAFHFRLLQALEPKYPGARTNLSVALARLGLTDEAYLTAIYAAKDLPGSGVAQYNASWFQNARGQYARAAKSVAFALQSLSTYDKALQLQVLNEAEAGREPPSQALAAIPAKQREHLSKTCPTVIAPAGAALRDRDRVAAKTAAAQIFTVSDRQEPWIAVYWPSESGKRRIWMHADDARAGSAAALNGVWRFKYENQPWATATFRPANGGIRGTVDANDDAKLRFAISSVEADGPAVLLNIRYDSGKRGKVKMTLDPGLRSMVGWAQLPGHLGSDKIVAEKLRE